MDKVIVDVEAGETRREPWTAEDEADREAVAQAEAEREAAEQADENAWRDAIRGAATLADLQAILAGDAADVPGRAARRPGQ